MTPPEQTSDNNQDDFKLSADELNRPTKNRSAAHQSMAKRDSKHRNTHSAESRNSKIWPFVLLIVISNASLGVFMWQQKQQFTLEISALESQYLNSQTEVGDLNQQLQHSSSLTNQTTHQLQQTLTELKSQSSQQQTQLNKANSEIRKLWVVAHQTNKPKIDELEKQTEQLSKRLSGITTHAKKQSEELANTIKAFENSAIKIETTQIEQVQTIENIKQQLVMTQNLALQVANLEELLQQEITDGIQSLTNTQNQQATSIKAINDHRQLINRQMDQLTDEIRAIRYPDQQGTGL